MGPTRCCDLGVVPADWRSLAFAAADDFSTLVTQFTYRDFRHTTDVSPVRHSGTAPGMAGI